MGNKKNTQVNPNLCLVNVNYKFLWWEWTTQEYRHNFVYYKEGEADIRECLNCEIKEMYWGINMLDVPSEEWRPVNYSGSTNFSPIGGE